jgi:hypothetical protein
MQRKHIRAVVGGGDVDIPIHTFTPNQFVFYDGSAIFTQVAVTPVGTPTPGHLAAWFTASSIVDSGVVLADVVTNPGTSVVNQLATFRDSTGKTIQAVTATVVGGAFSNVTTVNTRNVDDFITGPSTAVSGDILTFNGTTGKAAQDSGVLSTNIVTSTSTPSSSQIAVFTGSGKVVANSSVTITSGSLFSVVNINSRPVDSFVTGPNSAVNGNLPSFSGTTGRDVVDSGVSITNVATAGTGGSANQVATFTGVGKAIQPVTVTISGGAIGNVTAINGIDPATWVAGPTSSASGNLASFNGTTGKLIQDASIAASQVVTTASSPALSTVPKFTGSGKAVVATTVTIDSSGNVAANQYNGVTVENHHARHYVTGADSIYGDFGSGWNTNDVVGCYASLGSTTQKMYPRHIHAGIIAAATIGTTPVIPAGAAIHLGSSNHYIIEWNFAINFGDTSSGTISVTITWSLGFGNAITTFEMLGTLQNVISGVASSFTLPATYPLQPAVRCRMSLAHCGNDVDVSFAFSRPSGGGFTVLDGGTVLAVQANNYQGTYNVS